MYNSENYSYSNGGFNPVEPEQKPPKKSGGVGKAIASVVAIALVGGVSGYGGAYLARMSDTTVSSVAESDAPSDKQTSSVPSSPVTSDDGTANAAEVLTYLDKPSGTSLTTKEVIEKASPSVTFITSEFSNGKSSGTGIVLSSDGYIITNAHVVETEVPSIVQNPGSSNDPFGFFNNFYGNSYTTTLEKAKKVTVTLTDDSEYEAKIIGSDSNTDLAILKIEAKGLTAAEIGDSEQLEMGDKAITLGYPLGLGLSASDGIISGLDKQMSVEVSSGSTTMTLIQTDAAINPGNSGGPLLNEFGQVIGITSSKIVSSSVDGVGFAIPITDAMPILQELMTTGSVKNTIPKIGITGTAITSAVARYYSLPVESGVMVASVDPGSAAEKAGIAEGDVIVAADGEDVKDMDSLVAVKNKHKAGETMKLTLARNDGNVDVELILDADE